MSEENSATSDSQTQLSDAVDEALSEATAVVDEVTSLTADLQRVQAEYANYRKRVDRDRSAAAEYSVAAVLSELLPVLDDLDRAEQHGELTGGFKAVADRINTTVEKLGLTKFADAPVAFNPEIHEALMHEISTEVTEPTASKILQPGYKFKERVIRPARVVVTDPEATA
jgi:molecular chaperone GrpE